MTRAAGLLVLAACACGAARAHDGEWCGTTQAAMHEMSEAEERCERGDGGACLTASRMLDGDNLAGFRDAERAKAVRAHACALGVAEACGPRAVNADTAVRRFRDATSLEFERGSHELDAHAHVVLTAVVETLNAHPEFTLLELQGHAAEGEADPLALSLRRAEAAVRALVDLGVDPTRLRATALGTTCAPHRRAVTFRLAAIDRNPVDTEEC